MNRFRQIILLMGLVGLLWTETRAQQSDFHWKIGLHGGLTQYYGDLNTKFFSNNSKPATIFQNLDHISWGASLEKRLNRSFTLRIMGGKRQAIANDRAIGFDGNVQADGSYFGRALNAKMDIWEASAAFVCYSDNGHFLSTKAWISPYFSIGGGFNSFRNYADLWLGELGQQAYFYWSDGTIRNLSEQSANAAQAVVIEQDGDFETPLSNIHTEGVVYKKFALQASLSLGLKFRLGARVNLQLEAIMNYTSSDYLDDVHGDYPGQFGSYQQAYASNPSGRPGTQRGSNPNWNDLYATTTLSLHYSFGWAKATFEAPIIFTSKEGSMEEDSLTIEWAGINTENDSIPAFVFSEETVKKKDSIFIENQNFIIESPKYPPDSLSAYPHTVQEELAKLRLELTESKVLTELERMQLKADYEAAILKMMLQYEQQLNAWRWEWLRATLSDSTRGNPWYNQPVFDPNYSPQDTSFGNFKTKSSPILQYPPQKSERKTWDTLVILTKEVAAVDTKDKESLAKMTGQLETLEKQLALAAEKSDSLADLHYRDSIRNVLNAMTLKLVTIAEKDSSSGDSSLTSNSTAVFKKLQSQMDSMQANLNKPSVVDNRTIFYKSDNEALLNELKALRLQMAVLDTLQTKKQDTVSISLPTEQPINYASQIEGLSFEIALLRQELLRQKSTNMGTSAEPSLLTNARLKELEEENKDLRERLQAIQQSNNMILDFEKALREADKGAAKKDTVEINKLRERFHATQIYFGNSNTELTLQAKETINTLLEQVATYPEISLLVKGYASKSGAASVNLQLSKIRAEAVQRYILQTGKMEAKRIQLQYFGDTQSRGDDLLDRRAEIDVVIQKK